MAEELKASRRAQKGVLTKEINAVDRFMAEDDRQEVEKRFKKLKEKFADFETAQEKYHATLQDEAEIDESDEYFFKVQKSYVESVRGIKAWLASCQAVKPQLDQKDTRSSEDISRGELLGILNLPKIELKTFNGDPLQFYNFFAVFDEQVDRVTSDGRLKLSRLLQYTGGRAYEAIKSCSLLDGADGYAEARQILKKRFGSDHVISDLIMKNLKAGRPVKSAEDLQQLSDDISSSYVTLHKMRKLRELDTQSSIVEIVNRLQPYLKNRWKRHVFEYKREKDEYPDLHQLKDFIMRQAEEANDPIYGSSSGGRSSCDMASSSSKKLSSSFSTDVDYTIRSSILSSCIACGENHRLLYCTKFKTMKLNERLRLVRQHKLCENCLLSNHVTKNCRKLSVCSVPGCGQRHTKFIHTTAQPSIAPSTRRDTGGVSVSKTEASFNAHADVDVLVPLVKVTVNDEFETCVLLDSGSTTSFCTQHLVNKLGIDGTAVNYSLSTLSSSQEVRKSKLVDLDLTSADRSATLKLSNVYVVDCIPVNQRKLNLQNFPHLRDLPVDDLPSQVDILIGQDHAEALVPIKVRRGGEGEPFATFTLLGWSINGPARPISVVSRRVISHFVTANQIEDDFQNLWNIENEDVARDKSAWSHEDKQVVQLWDKEMRRVEGHYQLPIPWKGGAEVPNNMVVAMSRLKSLRVSLAKRGLISKYSEEIQKLCERHYAESVPPHEVVKADKIWYLPHQAVVSDKKPGKLRVVFDCASRYQGQSLNDKCLQGPNLTNKLLHVLLRFRNHTFAITADIEAMYHQVLVSPQDVDCLRFLWADEFGDIKHYRMLRHIFGGIWSGCAASYALRRTVEDFPGYDEFIKEIVLHSFYVDDCLVSLPNFDQAKSAIHETRNLLGHGGFKLTKFVANHVDLLAEIPSEDRASEVKLLQHDSKSKVLGLLWDVSHDQFRFEIRFESPVVVTRRVMLSLVSSLYDPLGLVSPVLINGKILLQDVTRMKLDWDQVVPSALLEKWKNWILSLQALKFVSIPRCIKPKQFDDGVFQLHHFSDANDRAYGCCSYLRCVNKIGEISVTLVSSKSRVAPLKAVSVPRLELQAAVQAVRLDSILREELHLELCESQFWVDSKIVLNYIYSDSRRFQVFVANRVSEIRNLTKREQWQHISGSENIADVITRGQQPHELVTGRWIRGPTFLETYKCEWQTECFVPDLSPDDEEIKRLEKLDLTCHVADVSPHPIDVLVSHFSSWSKVKRALAWWLRLKDKLLKGVSSDSVGILTVGEVKEAEMHIIRHVQSQAYKVEIEKTGSPKKSKLRDLSPFVNDQGLLCVGGRLKHAEMGVENKHPFIIPHDHPIARLIVFDSHNVAHLGTEWTLSRIRQRFWITRCRSIIKRIKRNCITCKRLFDAPGFQKMADLPKERLIAGKPPFSFVGVDCFGPFGVKLGRAEVKRYGCVYTCLNTRAIHIEKIDYMDADSFLNSFRRFCARRGMPIKVWSDNGSNFVGALSELNKSAKEIIKSKCAQIDVEWSFNPPCASHWGGIWERMIRSIRRVLAGILGNTRLNDEILSTVLCEVESIVNSRPITKVSSDPNDPAPLTPNHLLLLRGGPPPPMGQFDLADTYKKRWRHTQSLCCQFWGKWLREYLPILQKRNKWFDRQRNLKKGDLVLITCENTPRNLWPLGLIVDVRVGKDGLVRAANVKTKSTTFVRPVSKLVLLEGV